MIYSLLGLFPSLISVASEMFPTHERADVMPRNESTLLATLYDDLNASNQLYAKQEIMSPHGDGGKFC